MVTATATTRAGWCQNVEASPVLYLSCGAVEFQVCLLNVLSITQQNLWQQFGILRVLTQILNIDHSGNAQSCAHHQFPDRQSRSKHAVENQIFTQ